MGSTRVHLLLQWECLKILAIWWFLPVRISKFVINTTKGSKNLRCGRTGAVGTLSFVIQSWSTSCWPCSWKAAPSHLIWYHTGLTWVNLLRHRSATSYPFGFLHRKAHVLNIWGNCSRHRVGLIRGKDDQLGRKCYPSLTARCLGGPWYGIIRRKHQSELVFCSNTWALLALMIDI